MFSFFKKKELFREEEKQRIIDAVKEAEERTSGEVRIFVESRCSYVDALDRAREIFEKLGMYNTMDRNAVLIYVALTDHQLAVFGDEGIHQKVGTDYWRKEVATMISNFNREDYAEGIVQVVKDIGDALHSYFPYDQTTDKNELPDDIVFGK